MSKTASALSETLHTVTQLIFCEHNQNWYTTLKRKPCNAET